MKTVFLSGVAGFIGYQTALELLRKGVGVVGVDNLNTYYDPRLKHHRLELLTGFPEFSFHAIDIENRGELKELIASSKLDVIFNLAARAGVRASIQDPYIYLSTNALGTLNLLELAKEFNIPKFVLASTSSLYAGQPLPFREELPVNSPISPYAASKKAAEMFAYTHHYLYGIDVAVTRYFTVYGPAGRPDMSVYRFIRWIDNQQPIQIFGDGQQSRDFTYVADIALGTILAASLSGFEVVNLGGGQKPTTLLQMINVLENLLGKKAILEFKSSVKADMQDTQADISKAERLLGWRPTTSVEKGLEQTVRWYRDNKKLADSIDLGG